MSALGEARDRWLAQSVELDAVADAGPAGPAAARALRQAGRDAFGASGLPSTRLEEWRYTNLRPLAETAYAPAPDAHGVTRSDVESHAFPVFACSLFVFVNGRRHPELSAPGGQHVSLASDAPEAELRLGQLVDAKEHPLAALNQAFLEDAAVVRIARDERIDDPIHLVFVSTSDGTPTACHPRIRVEAETGSQSTVILDHVSLGPVAPRLTNAVTEVSVGANASLDLVLLQREDDAAHHVSNLGAELARDARLRTHTLTLGGSLVRNDLGVRLAEEGAQCELSGLSLGTAAQLIDNHTLVDHAVPHCRSAELYKGVLAGRSRGVFRGRVLVRPDAQKTDATQSNPNLLLSDGAEVNTKPQLEIYADDVKCSHGATIGKIDEEALFYLRARGIAADAARELLTEGFAAEVLNALPGEALGEALVSLFRERLRAGGAR